MYIHDISQGSVATLLRWGGIFSDSIITNVLRDWVVKKELRVRAIPYGRSRRKKCLGYI